MRKGILTPFHKLKGFERQIQEPGQSSRHSLQDNSDLVSTSLANAIQSISEAAQSRPTTKLLDSSLLPKLEPPTYPFQTPRKHVKISQSAENGRNDKKRKRRPIPGKKWRAKVSRENKDEGPGKFRQLILVLFSNELTIEVCCMTKCNWCLYYKKSY